MDTSVEFPSNDWKIIKDSADDVSDIPITEDVVIPPNSLDEDDSLDEEITSAFKDIKERLANDTSGQLKLGVRKFCQRYRMMSKQKFSNNRIASAFNKFGWVFGGSVTSVQGGLLRRGRRITVQATAAGRRRKTLSRGKSKAPSGRPVKKEAQIKHTKSNDLSHYQIPPRNLKPSKRLHSLSVNIALSQQNAGKW